ncbi:protein IMPACT [Aplysia californica]|uniref:Protein IMPACT n=1 Tax=Aplysia californica TaxID=6500 RepID=A0ABM0JGQ6_APLCA|nr:protein IMPACT [Aplysia californica]
MSLDDNISRQADEIEALTAIYGDEWCVIDSVSRIYCIRIADSLDDPKWKLSLQVVLPDDYPLLSPPQFQINATWLRGNERTALENKLSQIYCDNMGEDLIFMWVEGVREFLQDKSDKDPISDSVSDRMVVQTTEEDDADDDFDPSSLGDVTFVAYQADLNNRCSVPCPEIIHGSTLSDRRSTFQPHLASVTDKLQITAVMQKLLENKKIANATHNMLAYRIMTGSGPVYQGCDDDGETHAGSRMLHLLQIMNAENVMVVVSRWYGGIHLGPDRFKHINNCTRQILEENGFQRDKEEKKGPRSGKKSR